MPPLVDSRLKMPHSRRSESGALAAARSRGIAQPPEVLLDLDESRVVGPPQLPADDVQREPHGIGGRGALQPRGAVRGHHLPGPSCVLARLTGLRVHPAAGR